MIYIENKDGVQRVVIPTNDTNVEYVNFIPQEGDSDYYTKEQTNKLVEQSKVSTMNEVGDWLSLYATTDYVHEAVENVTVDLTGYATEEYVDAEIQKIPKPDMSDYYTKEETDREIDNALSAAPSMLESVGFVTKEWMNREGYATQDWVDMNYATTQYVDDAVANAPTGGGTEPFIVEVDSFEPITKTAFDQLFESYSQGIPSYIRKSGLPEQLIPVIGIQGTITGTIMPIAKMWVIVNNNLIEYLRVSTPNVGYTKIPLGGSGGSSGAKVYVAEWDDATAGNTRVTNQMVYDMFNSYYNDHLLVQLQMNDNIYTVYFAQDENPFYRVYMLAANIMGKLEGNINYPSGNAAYSEQPFVTREVFDKAIPHKYDYTITDDIALTGSFTEGEGHALFNDVKDGADVNFKLIMFEGQSKYIPFAINYDRYMDKVNFMFLDYGRYITCTLESNGNMSIGTENFN